VAQPKAAASITGRSASVLFRALAGGDGDQFNMDPNDDILTVAEAASRLRCSKAHVLNAINGKVKNVSRLPAVWMGRRRLVRRSALEAWLKANERGQRSAILPTSTGIDSVGA
jgi:excisionase family DNA binding protein